MSPEEQTESTDLHPIDLIIFTPIGIITRRSEE